MKLVLSAAAAIVASATLSSASENQKGENCMGGSLVDGKCCKGALTIDGNGVQCSGGWEKGRNDGKKSARKVKREAARAKKCAKRCANGNQKACDKCKKEEELIAEFLDMYEEDEIDFIAEFLFDNGEGDDEESEDYYSYN